MRIQKKCCDQCLFSENNIVEGESRRMDIIKEALSNDTFFICHKASIKDIDDVCCRAFWNNFKNEFNLGRIAQRLKCVTEVTIK